MSSFTVTTRWRHETVTGNDMRGHSSKALEEDKNKMSAVPSRFKSTRMQDLTCVNSQHGDVEPAPARNTDKRPQLEIHQQPFGSQSTPDQRNISPGFRSFVPASFIWDIYPSTFPRCLQTLCLSRLGLKLCRSRSFPCFSCCFPSLFLYWVWFNPRGEACRDA